MQRQALSLDLDSLFPGSSITIGNQSIVIRPLNIEQLSVLSKKVTGLTTILVDQGVTWENFNTPENLFKLAIIVLENVPDVLEEASNVDIEDLKKLPLEIIVQIVDAIISENLKSKEGMEKNFKSLIEKFRPVKTEKGEKTDEKVPTPLKKIPV